MRGCQGSQFRVVSVPRPGTQSVDVALWVRVPPSLRVGMVFSSVTFLFFFLPVFLAGYLIMPRRLRNAWLLLVSLVFYTWGSGELVWILFFSTAVDYTLGALVSRARDAGNTRGVRAGVTASVVVNLGLLAYFKYANFFIEEVSRIGILSDDIAHIILPIGISFFTFQSMSYTLDIARGRADYLKNPLDFGLYVAMFPQLIAGPIVRFHEIAEEIRSRSVGASGFADGVVRFAHGLSKKVLIADAVAPVADAAFAGGDLSTRTAWVGILAYTIQIYFDFSGYSDMAIGLGLMLGFHFPENFERPYSALSITDFWRRWHITLSNWFRDYVYIPLGGSRGTSGRTIVNLSTVFLLTGIWHGANWTFVVWGAFHGLLLVGERVSGQRVLEESSVARSICRRAYVVFAVMVGWVFFRSTGVSEAFDYLGSMFSGGGATPEAFDDALTNRASLALAIGGASFLLPRTMTVGRALVDDLTPLRQSGRLGVVFAMYPIALITVASGTFSPFLYFQF
jgi:alginate O-acetyltransferase complex protein AlgI